MQAGDVGRDCFPQLGNAEVVRIEGLAGVQSVYARLPDECGRDFVGLAEPEREHVVAGHAGVGHFANLRGAQAADGLARPLRGDGQRSIRGT